MELKPGMTPEEMARWRAENWTKEQLADELMRQEQRHLELIDRYHKLSNDMVIIAKDMIRKVRDTGSDRIPPVD
jgi:hypothetical protein